MEANMGMKGVEGQQPAVGVPYAYPPPPQPGYYGQGPPAVAPPPPQHGYYGQGPSAMAPPYPQQGYYGQGPPAMAPPTAYYVGQNPYQEGVIPPNAVFGDPKGVPLQQTMYRDTPAPFQCPYCGSSGLTTVKSKPSFAAAVGCMMTFMVGICFLCPCSDCLWHKYHYCPSCGEKVADFKKSDPCLVMDTARWQEDSFALPA